MLLRIEVHDTGIGIAPEQMPRLFKPFEQIDHTLARRFGGTGLGLAICRHLAHAMGGDCGATSEPDVGSRFWFTVLVGPGGELADPRGRPAARERPDATSVAATLAGKRLLVVEDDRVNQVILVEMLRVLGATHVDVAESGQEAIDATAAQPYDLVFMDVQLPGIDGLEATRTIARRRRGKRPPIVALTANVLPQDVSRCLEAGMDSHLAKPVSKDELAEALMRWLAKGRRTGASRRRTHHAAAAARQRDGGEA